MSREIYYRNIEKRIRNSTPGEIFITADFNDIVSPEVANKTLLRLSEKGLIRRVMRGVYEYPDFNELMNEYITPSPTKVAQAIARNFGWSIIPSGDTALNILGLSTQVPASWCYVSDGPYKKYCFDSITLEFRHTTNKEISKTSYKTGLFIQGLKALGKEKITDNIISKLSKLLSVDDKAAMLSEAKYATSWIYEEIKKICK